MIELKLLGTPSIKLLDTVISLEGHVLALVAYLALEGKTARETLAELFWTHSEPNDARRNLRQLLWRWRRSELLDVILINSDSLELHSEVRVDLKLFYAHFEANDHEAALRLVSGAPLEGFVLPNSQGFEAWLLGNEKNSRQPTRRRG
jgi:DNA-binding SARP family transcriptional activator